MLIDLKIIGGFLGFSTLALFGLALLSRGFRGDIYNWLGEARTSRWKLIVAGLLLVLPLIAWVGFLLHQGWFERWLR